MSIVGWGVTTHFCNMSAFTPSPLKPGGIQNELCWHIVLMQSNPAVKRAKSFPDIACGFVVTRRVWFSDLRCILYYPMHVLQGKHENSRFWLSQLEHTGTVFGSGAFDSCGAHWRCRWVLNSRYSSMGQGGQSQWPNKAHEPLLMK